MTSSFLNIARQGKNGWLRYVAAILLILGITLIIAYPVLLGIILSSGMSLDTLTTTQGINSVVYANPMLGLGFIGLINIAEGVGLYLAITRIHKRPFLTLISPDASIQGQRILQGFGLWLGLSLLSFAIQYAISPDNYSFAFNPSEWLPFALLAMLVYPIVSFVVTLLFYGYFIQGIGLIIRNPLILSIGLGAIFGSTAFNLEDPNATILGIFYVLFVFWVMLLDNRAELILGIALANNWGSSLLVAIPNDTFPTIPLFTADDLPASGSSLISLGIKAGLFYGVLLRSKGNGTAASPKG